MIAVAVPGFGQLCIEHLVCDYNGTLAADGVLLPGVAEALRGVAGEVAVHVVTADTFGRAAEQLEGLPLRLVVLPSELQSEAKAEYVARLGAERVMALGNGRNDAAMLRAARLGVALIQTECAATAALAAADLVATDVLAAVAMLHEPRRLVAALRS